MNPQITQISQTRRRQRDVAFLMLGAVFIAAICQSWLDLGVYAISFSLSLFILRRRSKKC